VVDHAKLLKDLQKQVRLLETDLRERGEDPTAIKGAGPNGDPETFDAYLKREYQRARDAERTATTEGEWREGQITQAAVAWVLSTVFLRFCEDNGLLEQPFIAGPKDERDRYSVAQELKEAWVLQGRSENPDAPERTDRDWLEHAFEQMSVSSVMAGLFDKRHNPMWSITPSHQAARALIDFWRTVGEDGHLVHDFTSPDWNTRFLGDLYQDLSETTRKTYALLQTPEFVEEFILDYTLEPAIEEFGLDGNRIYQADDPESKDKKGFRLIDPTCGSGHFLLGAFHRLLNKWREAEPGTSDWELINRSLRSVHGVDKNPYAVAIARFRLLIAAMKEGGITSLGASNPEWPIVVATGDSLLHGRGAPGVQDQLFLHAAVHLYPSEDLYEYAREHDLLGVASYHAVVGNPPYITVSDKQENQNYRDRYAACSGSYALSVPFAERFFNLSIRAGSGDVGPGFVGQITANTFMKRQFGKKLIEDFFRNEVRLTHVIDTSGAYIPGHGTPTVILFGRNEKNSKLANIRAVMGVRGEPAPPPDPSVGAVWSAIIRQVEYPRSDSEWVSSSDVPWKELSTHPWSLTGGGANELLALVNSASESILGNIVQEIGAGAVTREDSAYMLGSRVLRRHRVGEESIRKLVEGDVVRDWRIRGAVESCWPYDPSTLEASASDSVFRLLYPYRSILRGRVAFGKTQIQRGLKWFEYSMLFPARYGESPSITFAEVATHNHFVFDKSISVFNRTAPVVKFPPKMCDDVIFDLLGLLNSSVVCFWLKQVCQCKGNATAASGMADQSWSWNYQFSSTKLEKLPIPSGGSASLVREMESLTGHLSKLDPMFVDCGKNLSRSAWGDLKDEFLGGMRRMVSLQEELDWCAYYRYNIIGRDQFADLIVSEAGDVPEVNLGERAFEIVLARKLAAGEEETKWFSHHGSTPITEIPDHWPDAYKQVVAKRIELIESDKNINLLERPEYKRRWQSEPWDKKQKAALKSWLLDKCEDRRLWFTTDDNGDERTRPLSVRTLANRVRDLFPEAADVAALYDSGKDFSQVIAEIVKTEHVPYLAALRYKDTGMRKRADWEHVWDLQRQEDKLNANLAEGEAEKRLDIPVPPKYKSSDFRRNEYWSNRGKLDVPKERFISYPGAETDTDPTLLLGWAGWDHAQQADALATLAHERLEELGWGQDEDTRDKLVPLLAGLRELLPWVEQWHTESDEYGDTPADHVREDLTELRNTTGITDSQMTDWRPLASTRGRKKA
jgi:hypothetical protein